MESNHTGAESKSDGAGPAVMAHDRSDADTHTDPTREASAVCPPDGDTSSSSEESSDSSSESDDEETADSTAGAAPVDDKVDYTRAPAVWIALHTLTSTCTTQPRSAVYARSNHDTGALVALAELAGAYSPTLLI